MGIARPGIAWLALAGAAALGAAASGCIVDRDIFARESREERPPAPPPARPAAQAPGASAAEAGAWRNPYLATEEESAAAEASAEGRTDEAPPGDADVPPAQPMTAAEAAAALADDAGDEEPPGPGAGPPPPAAAEPGSQSLLPLAQARALTGADDVPPPGAEVEPTVFYDRLSRYGRWIDTPEYGRVWVPSGVASDWRPYWDGRWMWTEWGWTFVSDDPWGWAAWHYGRWGFGIGIGWYWIPGAIWAPAWVSWRWGWGWACWAPWGHRWSHRSPAWVVVRARHFTRPISAVALPPRSGVRAIATARPLPPPGTRPRAGGAFGPPRHEVEASVGHPVAQRPVAAALRPRAGGRLHPGSRGGPAGGPVARPWGATPGTPSTSSGTPWSNVRPGRVRSAPRPRAPGERGLEPGGSAVVGRVRPHVAQPASPLPSRSSGSRPHAAPHGGSSGRSGGSSGGGHSGASSGSHSGSSSGSHSGSSSGSHSSSSSGSHSSSSSGSHSSGHAKDR